MIQEAYVSLELAKALARNGFKEQCRCYYLGDEEMRWTHDCQEILPQGVPVYECPTLQMAMSWLRLVHGIYVSPEYGSFFQERPKKVYHRWCCKIVGILRCFESGIQSHDVLNSDYFFFHGAQPYHDSYEQAAEECIKYALENLIKE